MNLNQVTVPSVNVAASKDFYQKMGLRLIVESLPDYLRFECPEGESTFSVHQVTSLPDGEGVSVYFECKNLDRQVAQLKEAGIDFDELPTDKPWLWREARLRDPDQNRIILYYAGENRKYPPWRIN